MTEEEKLKALEDAKKLLEEEAEKSKKLEEEKAKKLEAEKLEEKKIDGIVQKLLNKLKPESKPIEPKPPVEPEPEPEAKEPKTTGLTAEDVSNLIAEALAKSELKNKVTAKLDSVLVEYREFASYKMLNEDLTLEDLRQQMPHIFGKSSTKTVVPENKGSASERTTLDAARDIIKKKRGR